MKSLAIKFIAIVLAALCLLTGIASVLGMIVMAELELTEQTPDALLEQELRQEALSVAYSKVRSYLTYTHSTAPKEVIRYAADVMGMVDAYEYDLGQDVTVAGWKLTAADGATESEGSMAAGERFRFEAIAPSYDQVHPISEIQQEPGITDRFSYGGVTYGVIRCSAEPCAVEVMLQLNRVPDEWSILFFIYGISDMLPLILLGCLLLFGMVMVYLCWVAGRKKGVAEIHPGGLNALPLDVYAVAVAIAGFLGVRLVFYLVECLENYGFTWMLVWLAMAVALLICLLPVVYIFAIAAQVKAKNHFWWRRSLVGFVLIRVFRVVRWCFRALGALCRMIPVIWQWLLTAALMVIVPIFLLAIAAASGAWRGELFTFLFLVSLMLDVCLVLYGGYCFGKILRAARQMADGDLDRKVNIQNMAGAFLDCAENLNALSEGAMVAAQKQMKSERMKTELIANVSHDIKTPLTSIINYVDLLQKPHSEEENGEYLEVLARQSQRLKKLTEDLVEMSKASTGNITAELTDVDACEAVRQALGEFAGKLEEAALNVVFSQPEEPLMIRADGRLTWRVLSNLLNNAVKYAQPGSRLYVDVTKIDNRVLISLKNMSREQLNVTAEELMERFVRGDASRHTEGSGLGLNIAKGLMEAQNGTLHLHIDGDLFKVTLFFPTA